MVPASILRYGSEVEILISDRDSHKIYLGNGGEHTDLNGGDVDMQSAIELNFQLSDDASLQETYLEPHCLEQ